MFLFWNWCKKKKENNVFGQTRIIVENNGRNFYGTFKEKKQQQQFRRKTCLPRIITSSHIHSRLNFNLDIRCFLHSSASLQFCFALYDSFQRAAIAVTHLCQKTRRPRLQLVTQHSLGENQSIQHQDLPPAWQFLPRVFVCCEREKGHLHGHLDVHVALTTIEKSLSSRVEVWPPPVAGAVVDLYHRGRQSLFITF